MARQNPPFASENGSAWNGPRGRPFASGKVDETRIAGTAIIQSSVFVVSFFMQKFAGFDGQGSHTQVKSEEWQGQHAALYVQVHGKIRDTESINSTQDQGETKNPQQTNSDRELDR